MSSSSTTFVGETTAVFTTHQLKSAIGMWRKFKMFPTPASRSGKKYKASECEKAEADLKAWRDAICWGTEVTRKP